MASSLDDMPAYELFQTELDILLVDFLKDKIKVETAFYHFFIEFITFHCQYDKRESLSEGIIKKFTEWYSPKFDTIYSQDNLESDLKEFLMFILKTK